MSRLAGPEQGISSELPFSSHFLTVNRTRLHYIEQGAGDPVLFLHGIPANLYLWRNVLPHVSSDWRALALDLAGYGKSDVPASGGYDANNQYTYLEGFIEQLGLRNLTLVVTDLGSLLGLHYAAHHPENVRGIILLEGMFMPADAYYRQLPLTQRLMYGMFRSKRLARAVLSSGWPIQGALVQMMTLRKLSAAEKSAYSHPYAADPPKRRVVLEGPGPVDFPRLPDLTPATATNEAVVMMNENAHRLRGTPIPWLLLYAEPGVVVQAGARQYAQENYPHLTLVALGQGKHFLSEDHPAAIGQAIRRWLATPLPATTQSHPHEKLAKPGR